MNLLKNPEFKSIVTKLAVMQLIFAAAAFLFVLSELEGINRAITDQNTALAGKILLTHPELEDELVGYITRDASEKEVNRGRQVLMQYGYDLRMDIGSQPVLKKLYRVIEAKTAVLVLACLIPLVLLVGREYGLLFSRVRRISLASEKVVEGDFSIVLPEDREGDFGILGYHFNQMANRLKLSLDTLKQDKLFLKNIISDISHQLKTPLSSLIMLNEIMTKDKDMNQQTRLDFLDKSKAQLYRMEWLIKNLLKLARLEAGAINFERNTCLLLNSVETAAASLNMKAMEKCIDINIKEHSRNIRFNGDEEWTAEAFANIIKNCIEHTAAGGRIDIDLYETPLFSSITIRDTGEGIDKKDIPRIFERFYKAGDSTKTESVGIGLSLAKLIIEGQNGTIAVKSEKGKGTEFIITFLKGVI